MPTKKLTVAQQRKIKSQLSKLKDLGLYKGDLRKKPAKAADNALRTFADVLSGKSTVVKPSNPGRFKGIYRTVGKSVIVPKAKGERITIDKTGEIVSKRKVGNRTVTRRGIDLPKGKKIPKPDDSENVRTQYVIPFNASGGETNWMRFPDWQSLENFMAGYNYKGWQDYVIEEKFGEEIDDDELNERLERKRKGRRIKGGIKKKTAPKKKARNGKRK